MEKLNILGKEHEIWAVLKEENRPILIYGMGDGAAKIIDALRSKNIPYADVFASNSFVRNHDFLGKKVLRYDDAIEKHGDFVVLLAFGSAREEMFFIFNEMEKQHSFFSPEVPLFGDGLFDYNFVEGNLPAIEKAYACLADDLSKKTFEDVLNFKISGKMSYLKSCTEEREETLKSLFSFGESESFLDLGAYDGDTVEEFLALCGGNFAEITAVEADRKNFKKMQEKLSHLPEEKLRLIRKAIWNEATTLHFKGRGGRNSALVKNGEHEVLADSIDNIMEGRSVSYIKMDVEGAEEAAILGGEKTINLHRPKLAVSAYHKNEDFFYLVNLINEKFPFYDIYLRHHPYVPAWETNIYAVARESE